MSAFELAVLGRDAERMAAGAALKLAAGASGPVVVVSDTGPPALSLPVPASREARRLADLLGSPGTPVMARGRLVFVWPAGDLLVEVARGALAVSAGVVVLALGAPRTEATDVLLAESAGVALVAQPDGPLARLALAQLEGLGVSAGVTPASSGEGAAFARLGWPAPSWLAALADSFGGRDR